MKQHDHITDIRSGVRSENLQELIDAGASGPKAVFQHGQQQYQSPEWLAEACAALMPGRPDYAFDPQCAGGNLVKAVHVGIGRLGCEIDNAFAKAEKATGANAQGYRIGVPQEVSRITASCVRLGDVLDELLPDLRFPCIVANPPFGLRWKLAAGGTIESTDWTWRFIKARLAEGGSGFFIASSKTIEELRIPEDPLVYLYQKFPAGGIWTDVSVAIGIVHYQKLPALQYGVGVTPHVRIDHLWPQVPTKDEIIAALSPRLRHRYFSPYTPSLVRDWTTAGEVIADDTRDRPKYNIYLDAEGMLRTYLSTRAGLKVDYGEVSKLARINNCHPLTLTTERETRTLLHTYLTDGRYTIEPAAKIAISKALAEVLSLSCPIRPVNDYQMVAYADEYEKMECKAKAPPGVQIALTVGKFYEIRTGTYKFSEKFTRKKIHYDETTEETTQEDHECYLSGEDRYIEITDDTRRNHQFMERPPGGHTTWKHSESLIWQIFKEPYVPTVAETDSVAYQRNLEVMKLNELISGFTYFPGQLDYYARMGCKDYGLIAADVGTGKSLGALTIIALKAPRRTLIIAPQGTMRSAGDEEEVDYEASQWVKEIARFAPTEPVFQLFSREDWLAVLHANGGELPPGIYITYPAAYFSNGGFENCPPSWEEKGAVEINFCTRMDLKFDEDRTVDDCFSRNVGASNKSGIKCIASPVLATEIATHHGEWDMVILDEAHLCCNLGAQISQKLIRLQPKYRFAMTATPIPNIVSNLFSLMGWVCVPGWYKDKVRNAAWPYAVSEIGRFNTTFLSQETDVTAQYKAKAEGKRGWRGVGITTSPLISSPARLLKLLAPNMAYISKEDCNPHLHGCEVIDVRVPMGKEQARLYGFWLNRKNYITEFKGHMLTIARVQSTRLRGICGAPASVDYARKMCESNFNAKTVAILGLVRDCLSRGEQAVIVSAFVHQSSLFAKRLSEAGIPLARIDSSVGADMHVAEANRFKRGDARVMLMGIKCAQGHSFDQCPNLIVGSLEWSYGTLHQAKGRVWRLTSPQPVKVWVVLHENTIEELLFDRVAVKQDSATLCLHGKRIPRDFRRMDAAEVLADHIINYKAEDGEIRSETECESQWPALRKSLVLANAPVKRQAA